MRLSAISVVRGPDLRGGIAVPPNRPSAGGAARGGVSPDLPTIPFRFDRFIDDRVEMSKWCVVVISKF